MTAPNGGRRANGGGESAPSTSAQQEQYQELGFIQVLSFTAKPPKVEPFTSTTLSWSVKLPTSLHVPVSFTVAGKTFSGTFGAVAVTPFADTEYALTAKTALVSRSVGALTVAVDSSACSPATSIPIGAISGLVNLTLTSQFQGSSGFALAGQAKVTSSTGVLTLSIPLHVSVPDYFDATMTITQPFTVGMSGLPPNAAVAVSAGETGVDVSWAWYATVLSVGVTSGVAAIADAVSRVFINYIAQTQFAAAIAGQLTTQVENAAERAKNADPQHRTFKLTSFVLDELGVTYTVCPLPAPPAPPPTHSP